MQEIDSYRQLAASLIGECLIKSGVVTHFVRFSTTGNVVKIGLGISESNITINLVLAEIEEDEKCMVTLYDEAEKVIGSQIYNYEKDLLIEKVDIKFPLKWGNYIRNRSINTLSKKIMSDFNLNRGNPTVVLSPSNEDQGKKSIAEPAPGALPVPNIQRPTSSTRGEVDLPKFEDEYEINEGSKLGNLPGLGGLRDETAYGDVDLYPMGQKHPFGNPNAQFKPPGPGSGTGNGGMIFDPFGTNRKQEYDNQDDKKGPGFIPGSRYDDPFGRPGPGGTGNRGFPGPGSGSGTGFGFL